MSERVKEIRERLEDYMIEPEEWGRHYDQDVRYLLAEIERVTAERDAWKHTAEIIGKRPNPEMERLREALGVVKECLDKIVGTAQVPLHMVGIRAPSSKELMQWRRDYDMEVAREALTQISRIEAGGDGKE